MEYRTLGKLDWKPSALGFGCMRLPTADGSALSPDILQKDVDAMFSRAIELGVNYFDTAYPYHSGKSEQAVGKALKPYRDKVKIATKSPVSMLSSKEEFDRILDIQLERLGVEMVDFYLFHGIGAASWEKVMSQGLLERAEAAQKAGKIGHIAFSFHDSYDVFEKIINEYDKWLFCQIQYNFIDDEMQAGMKGLKLAASKGIGVVVMEPLRGGKLSRPIPAVKELMAARGVSESLTSLSLKWLWAQPEVSVVLSGMSAMEQLSENVETACMSYKLSDNEIALLGEIKELYASRAEIPCTGCGYCLPCPKGINIPQMLGFYNEGAAYDYFIESRRVYNFWGRPASSCGRCRECEAKCPQSIPISEWMPKIDQLLTI